VHHLCEEQRVRDRGLGGGAETLADLVHLDTVVTVVDTPNFLENFNSQQSIGDRPDLDRSGTADRAPVVQLLVEQVEFANVVVLVRDDVNICLSDHSSRGVGWFGAGGAQMTACMPSSDAVRCCQNKRSEVSEVELSQVQRIVEGLSPRAKIVATDFSKLCPTAILCTGLFDFEVAEVSFVWGGRTGARLVSRSLCVRACVRVRVPLTVCAGGGRGLPRVTILWLRRSFYSVLVLPPYPPHALPRALPQDMPGWEALQDPSWVPKVAAASIRHMLYQRGRPFHPGRLSQLLGVSCSPVSTCPPVWLAACLSTCGGWTPSEEAIALPQP
jgi:G3E family GTPase